MLKRLAPHILLSLCFAIFLSPVWAPRLEGLASEFRILVADRPDLARTRAPAQRPGDITGSIGGVNRHITTLRADPRGHFETQAQINGRPIEVMVDTGATSVALRYEDALRLGLKPDPDDFTIPIATANGTTRAARVTLGEVRIGDLKVRNVEAMIVPAKGLQTNLLGMSFMRRLSRVEMAGGKLMLQE